MSRSPAKIYLLAGVTAVGKSEHSIDLAESLQCEVLSCDSISIYRGMDIGSAKPGKLDRQKIPHHGIDLVDVHTKFSVVNYAQYAKGIIDELEKRHSSVLVAGGSGFYLQSFLSPVVDRVEVTPEIRERVEEHFEKYELSGLVEELKKLNPEGLGELDVLNPRRVMRGLERCLASGLPLLHMKKEFENLPKPYDSYEKRMVWLDRDNEELEKRISDRTNQMIANGLIEETENLLASGIRENPSASSSVGYRECIAFLDGELEREELPKAISHSTRRLVFKQRKWFRKHLGENSRIVIDEDKGTGDPHEWIWATRT